MVGLGDLPGGNLNSPAQGVSADGNVVVGVSDSASGREAFRWTSGTGMVGLGDLPGGDFESRATAVSADGSVVVGDSQTGTGEDEAFIWTQAKGMQRLVDVLVVNGATGLSGWGRLSARGISANGHWVVGGGINPSGDGEAFLANRADLEFHAHAGSATVSTLTPLPLKSFPTLQALTPVPSSMYTEAQLDPVSGVRCQVTVLKNGSPVKKAKGNFNVHLYVFTDHPAAPPPGTLEVHGLDSGKFRTGKAGIAVFSFEIPLRFIPIPDDPSQIRFVTAWVDTRADFFRKRGDIVSLLCEIAAVNP